MSAVTGGGSPRNAGATNAGATNARQKGQPDRYALALGGIAVLEALTFLVASLLHLGAHIPVVNITGDKFPGAVVPEVVIGFVMLAGAAMVLAAPRRAWGIALGTHVFAAAGTCVGIAVVLSGFKHRPAADPIYHFTILTVLLVMIGVLARGRSRAALRRPS